MSLKTIILDFDGTLIESVGIKDQAFKQLFSDRSHFWQAIEKYHLSHNATIRYKKFKYIVENILKETYDEEYEKRLSQRFSNLIFEQMKTCPYVKGAIEFLNDFYGKIPLYLISISPENELMKVLQARDLVKFFKKIYAVSGNKEKFISQILERENISADSAIFISDTPEDYQSALIAQVPFVGRDSGKFKKKILAPVYQDFDKIRQLVEEKYCEVI